MKRPYIYIIGVGLLLSLAGCSDDEVSVNDDGQAIRFECHAPWFATRSVVNSISDLQGGSFGVFAYHTEGDNWTNYHFADYDGEGTPPALTARIPNFMYNQHVTWDGEASAWTYSPMKYWPNGRTSANESGTVTGSGGMVSYFFYAPYVDRPSSYTDADGNPLDGLVWDSYSDRIGEFDNGSLTSWTGGYYTNGFYTYCENDTTPCTGKTIAFRPDGNGGFSKMTCTDSSLTNCTTTQYNNKGKVIAEYDADNKLITMNDYADNGNKLVYNDQCELVARYDAEGNELAMPYRIGDGLKASDRHVLYTLPEAASIIKNSNDNSLIMYFK